MNVELMNLALNLIVVPLAVGVYFVWKLRY